MNELPSSVMKRPNVPPLWDSEKLFFDGDLYYADVIADINAAKKRVTVEMYIFEDDAFGVKFFGVLQQAAIRGVQVQIVLDGVGSHQFIQRLQKKPHHSGIKIKVFNPHPWTFSFSHPGEFIKFWGSFFRRLWWINRRDHRKVITIDEKITYIGSFNITNDHLKEYTPEPWRDMGLRLTGTITPLMIVTMIHLWGMPEYLRLKKALPPFARFDHPDIRLNQSFRLRRAIYRDFLKHIKSATQRIWIRPGYFLPKNRVVRLLAEAARRGVDVRILVSDKSDIAHYPILQGYHDVRLVKEGVKIYRYKPAIAHAKSYIVDDWMTVGSTNLNHRSFLHDLEVDVVVQHPANKKLLLEEFEKMEVSSLLVTEEWLKDRPWWEHLLSNILYQLRRWT